MRNSFFVPCSAKSLVLLLMSFAALCVSMRQAEAVPALKPVSSDQQTIPNITDPQAPYKVCGYTRVTTVKSQSAYCVRNIDGEGSEVWDLYCDTECQGQDTATTCHCGNSGSGGSCTVSDCPTNFASTRPRNSIVASFDTELECDAEALFTDCSYLCEGSSQFNKYFANDSKCS